MVGNQHEVDEEPSWSHGVAGSDLLKQVSEWQDRYEKVAAYLSATLAREVELREALVMAEKWMTIVADGLPKSELEIGSPLQMARAALAKTEPPELAKKEGV
jgi:hypothetical protein